MRDVGRGDEADYGGICASVGNTEQAIERKDRDESGKFVKGNKVANPRAGRPRKIDSMPILLAITQEYSPEELGGMLRETYRVAKMADDAKAMLQVVKLVMDYAIGKPVVRTLSASIDPAEVRDILAGFGRPTEEEVEDEQDGDVIEVEAG